MTRPLGYICLTLICFTAIPAAADQERAATSPPQTEDKAENTSPTPSFSDTFKTVLHNSGSDLDGEDEKDHAAMIAFYNKRQHQPLWTDDQGLTRRAQRVIGEIKNADSWGLNSKAFKLPQIDASGTLPTTTLDALSQAEVQISLAVLKYMRHARGGRIMKPSEMLASHIDRKPKLMKRDVILQDVSEADEPDKYLRSLHNVHQQYHRLRYALLARLNSKKRLRLGRDTTLKAGDRHKMIPRLRARLGLPAVPADQSDDSDLFDEKLAAAVKHFQKTFKISPTDGVIDVKTLAILNNRPSVSIDRLVANMEQWRWMWNNMGDLYVLANVPEFMLHVYKFGDRIHSEKIVAGEIGKQTSIFSRPLRDITFRPMWRVPESIKVNELWPNLRRGGSMFRRYGLKLETKDGKPLNYRKIDWRKEDIRKYEVVQPPGRKSVMGVVKFSFPSQHTIFMHDTPDKYMFKARQRTLSHGCLRVRKPVKLAELLLAEDKGWGPDKIKHLIKSGPNNNQVMIDREIPIHIVYFTTWVDDKGKVHTYRDVYGHEKRIRYALKDNWNKISKGRDHLAPVTPSFSRRNRVARGKKKRTKTPNDYVGAALGQLF